MAWDDDKSAGNVVTSDDYDERTVRIKEALGSADSITFVDGDTTPSVDGATICLTANTVLTVIADLDDATKKVIVIIFGDALTSIAHNANIKLMGGALLGPVPLYSTLLLAYNGSVWAEVSRSINGA